MLRVALIAGLLASAVLAEDKDPLPPLPDAATVRGSAKKAGRPCAFVISVEHSTALFALSKKVPLGAVSSDNDDFRREFGIEPGVSWVVVLDGKGETLGSAAAAKDPAAQIEGFFKRTATLEALERKWTKEPKNRKARDEYLARCDEAGAWEKSGPIWDGIAADAALPRADRDHARVRAFLVRRPSRKSADEYRDTWNAAVKTGEALAVELPGVPEAKEILEKLHGLLSDGFDAMAKIKASNARMADAAKALGQKAPAVPESFTSKQRILVTSTTGGTSMVESELDRAITAAKLGDPGKTIEFFSQAPYDQDAQYGWWVAEAKAKAGK